MADPIVLPALAGGNINAQAAIVGQAVNTGVYYYAIVSVLTLAVAIVFGFLFWQIYKAGFNIRITILDNTKGGILIREGYQGKYTQTRPGEFRFKILDAKKYRFRYNQESLSPEDFFIEVTKKGKVRRKVFMTYDSEGQLLPAKLDSIRMLVPRLNERGLPILDSEGRPIVDSKNFIAATVKQVDVSWFFKEMDKKAEIFDARSAWDKWGWLVLTVALILVLGAFMYTSYQFAHAAKAQELTTGNMARMIEFMQNSTVTVASR